MSPNLATQIDGRIWPGPLIALEAQTRSGSVQAWDGDGRCCYSAPALGNVRAAARLPAAVVAALEAVAVTGVSEKDVPLAILRGPGAFTGLRISAFCARALAWDAQTQIVPVDHLAALAAVSGVALEQRVFVAVSLKKDTTFIGVYVCRDGVWAAVVPAVACIDAEPLPAHLAEAIAECSVATGPAWHDKATCLRQWWARPEGIVVAPRVVTPLAVARAAVGQSPVPWQEALPLYGQASAAELQRDAAGRKEKERKETVQEEKKQ